MNIKTSKMFIHLLILHMSECVEVGGQHAGLGSLFLTTWSWA